MCDLYGYLTAGQEYNLLGYFEFNFDVFDDYIADSYGDTGGFSITCKLYTSRDGTQEEQYLGINTYNFTYNYTYGQVSNQTLQDEQIGFNTTFYYQNMTDLYMEITLVTCEPGAEIYPYPNRTHETISCVPYINKTELNSTGLKLILNSENYIKLNYNGTCVFRCGTHEFGMTPGGFYQK